MLAFFKGYFKFFIFLFVLSAVILALFYNALRVEDRLPFYHPGKNVNPELIDSTIVHVKKGHKISDFKLLNQNGDTITQKNYEDKIYVADFFFTTCGTICPVMTTNMKKVQHATLLDGEIMLLSHSVMPHIDTVAQLKKYAREKGVISKKWNLVTGSREQIYNLARKSYLVAKYNPTPEDRFNIIHTENFVLVDKKKRIRGMYDGTNDEDIEKLLEDIEILKKEYQD